MRALAERGSDQSTTNCSHKIVSTFLCLNQVQDYDLENRAIPGLLFFISSRTCFAVVQRMQKLERQRIFKMQHIML